MPAIDYLLATEFLSAFALLLQHLLRHAVDHSTYPRPVNCSGAHITWLRAAIERSIFQGKAMLSSAVGANRQQFSMSSGVGQFDAPVSRLRDTSAIDHQYSTKWILTGCPALNGEFNCPPEEPLVLFFCQSCSAFGIGNLLPLSYRVLDGRSARRMTKRKPPVVADTEQLLLSTSPAARPMVMRSR